MDPATLLLLGGAGVLGYSLGVDSCAWRGREFSDEPPTEEEEKVEEAKKKFEPWLERQIEPHEKMGGIIDDYLWYSRKATGWIVAFTPGFIDLVAAYYMMLDPETPMTTKAIVASAILYIVSPLDVIPDEIPVVGVIDDLGVLKATLMAVASSLRPRHYELAKNWFESRGIDIPFYEPMVPRISEHAAAYGP